MDTLFNPKSIALIGVSDKPTNLARNIMINLQNFGFTGEVYPVGPRGGEIFGKKIFKSVSEICDNVELAVILTPANTIPEIVEECGKKGIRNAVVLSAGFREYGDAGKERERRLLEVTNKYGIRFIGPNCIGLANFHNGLFLPFLVFKQLWKKGGVSLVTQSGGIGVTLLYVFADEGIGVAKFASIGNKLNIDENDLIEYLINDDETEVIVVYLEGISDGRRLMELGRKSNKPILLYKANTGILSKSIAASHTAALSSDDAVVDAALSQSGIARFKDRQTLLNYLKVLPLPKIKGDNLAILSRSGGHAILAADAAEECGFKLAPLKESFTKEIEKHFRANVIKLTNPIDLGDVFDYDLYLKIIEMTVQESNVDGVFFLHTSFSELERQPSINLIEKTAELSNKYGKPVGVYLATDADELHNLRKVLNHPVFTSPLEMIKSVALARNFNYGVRQEPKPAELEVNKNTAKEILDRCVVEKRSPSLQEGLDIFEAYGIPTAPNSFAKNETEALAAADKIGYPIALKIVSGDISHKTEFGGVETEIKNINELKDALNRMSNAVRKKSPTARIDGYLLQTMVSGGWEMIVGAKRDHNFGPVVLTGLGGIFAEVFKDTALRVLPIDSKTTREMIKELKGYPILKGTRGRKPYDIDALEDCVNRIGKLISDFPEISEIDANPFFIMTEGKGGLAVDARIIL